MSIKKIVLGTAVAAMGLAASADTLYWQVADADPFTTATLYAIPTASAPGDGTEITTELADGVSTPTGTGTSLSTVGTDITGYGSSYSFYVELYNASTGNTWSPNKNYPWTYTELYNSGCISTGNEIAPPSGVASGGMNGGAVPEPTSGMMLLIGASLLALRRRRA